MSMPIMGVPDKKQRKFNVFTIEECGHGSKDKNAKFEDWTEDFHKTYSKVNTKTHAQDILCEL